MRSAWLDVDWDAVRRRTMVDGTEIEYVDLGCAPTHPPPNHPAMVFIHGLGASWQSWLENLPYFARTHRCVALDLPGFGASGPVAGQVSIERYARSVAYLCERLGITSAVMVGNSMGGFIALEMALRFPELASELVLISPAVFWQEQRHAGRLVALARATDAPVSRVLRDAEPWLVRPRLRSLALGLSGVRRTLPEELQAELLRTKRRTKGYVPALRALASYPLRPELRRVRCPVLVVWGDADPQVSVRDAYELERELPDAKLSVYPGAGHMVMLEAPERFNAEVAAFIG